MMKDNKESIGEIVLLQARNKKFCRSEMILPDILTSKKWPLLTCKKVYLGSWMSDLVVASPIKHGS